LIYGTFGSGLISLWARMGTFFGQNDAQMIFSVLSFGRGLGVVLSGAVSPALLTAAASRTRAQSDPATYGNGQHLGIVLFVGVTMAVSALTGSVGFIWGWRRRELGSPREKKGKKEGSQAAVV
jgi:hypothetical protein